MKHRWIVIGLALALLFFLQWGGLPRLRQFEGEVDHKHVSLYGDGPVYTVSIAPEGDHNRTMGWTLSCSDWARVGYGEWVTVRPLAEGRATIVAARPPTLDEMARQSTLIFLGEVLADEIWKGPAAFPVR